MFGRRQMEGREASNDPEAEEMEVGTGEHKEAQITEAQPQVVEVQAEVQLPQE